MSKQETSFEQNTLEVPSQEGSSPVVNSVQSTINIVIEELKQIKRKVAEKLLQATIKNNGKVDVNIHIFDKIKKSFLDADTPVLKNGVPSLTNTIKDVRELIAKEIEKGNNEKSFNGLQKEINKFQQEIKGEFASNNKVEILVKEGLKYQTIFDSAKFIKDSKEKANLVNEIETAIIIPDFLNSVMLKNDNNKDLLDKQITPHITKYFTTKGKISGENEGEVIDSLIFDKKKLTPVNVEKFTYETNTNLESYAIILASIEKLEKEGTKLNAARQEKITTQLLSSFVGLDPQFLRKNSEEIVSKLSDDLKSNIQSKKFSFSKDFTISTASLKKIANDITNDNQEKSSKFIDNKIGLSSEKNDQEISKLTLLVKEFATQNKLNGVDGATDINMILDKKYPNLIPIENGEIKFEKNHIKSFAAEQWRELRKINPVGFDKLILTENSLTSTMENREVTDGFLTEQKFHITDAKLEALKLIQTSIENLQWGKEKGSKVNVEVNETNQEKIEARQKKIRTQLLPAIEALDPDFLRANSTEVIKNLVSSLNSNSTVLTKIKKYFVIPKIKKHFAIPTASLEKIADDITNNFKKENSNFIDNKIGLNAEKNDQQVSELTALVKEFATQNKLNGIDGTPDINKILGKEDPNLIPIKNGEIKFEKDHIKSFTNEQWRELRKVNPVGFDKVVLKSTDLKTNLDHIPFVAGYRNIFEAGLAIEKLSVDIKPLKEEGRITPSPTPFKGKARTLGNNGRY